MTKPFKPTHRITIRHNNGVETQCLVMLVDGVAYTRAEWDAYDSADWTRNDAGEWLFQGRATPDGAVSVEVKGLK